jgi:hypothetical protein
LSEAGNVLKTKDRKRTVSKDEAGNILKRKPVTKNHRDSPKPDKMTAGRTPRAGGGKRPVVARYLG